MTKQAAVEMLESDDLVGIGMEAHAKRLEKNDPRVVTYPVSYTHLDVYKRQEPIG